MCRKIKKRRPFHTAVEMFYALPDQLSIDPIEKIKLNDFGELTIAAKSEFHHHNKNMSLASFQKFCSKHRDKIT